MKSEREERYLAMIKKKNFKNFGVSILTLSLVTLLFLGCAKKNMEGEDGATEKVFLSLATGGTAGTYFPLGGGIADVWTKTIPGMNATAEATGASVANINMLRENDVDVAFVQNDIAFYASTGVEMFEDNVYPDIRGLMTLYPETVQIVTLADSGVQTLKDLPGKSVAVGAIGSGTEANARQILALAGLSYDDIDVKYLSFSEGAQNLKDGNVDVAFVTAGFPTAAIQDISAQRDVVLVPVPAMDADTLIGEYPFYTKIVIPAGTYPNQTEDINSVAVKAMLVVDSSLSAEMGNSLVTAILENTDRLTASHPKGANIKKETATDGMSIEMNPGAIEALQ